MKSTIAQTAQASTSLSGSAWQGVQFGSNTAQSTGTISTGKVEQFNVSGYKPLYGFDDPVNDAMAEKTGNDLSKILVGNSAKDLINNFQSGMVKGVQNLNMLIQREGQNFISSFGSRKVNFPIPGTITNNNANTNNNSTVNNYYLSIDNQSVQTTADIKKDTRNLMNSALATKYFGRSIL